MNSKIKVLVVIFVVFATTNLPSASAQSQEDFYRHQEQVISDECVEFQRQVDVLSARDQTLQTSSYLGRARAELEMCNHRLVACRSKLAQIREAVELAKRRLEEAIERNQQEQDDHARKERLSHDPSWMRPVISALICYDAWVVKASKAEIEKEKLYARKGGGIVDKSKIYDLQLHMRKASEDRAETLAALRGMHLDPLPCSAASVHPIDMCMREESGDWCSREGVKEHIEFVGVPEGPTWTCRGSNCD